MTADLAAIHWDNASVRLWLMGPDGGIHGERRGPEAMRYCLTANVAPGPRAPTGGSRPELPAVTCGTPGIPPSWAEMPHGAKISGKGIRLARRGSGTADENRGMI